MSLPPLPRSACLLLAYSLPADSVRPWAWAQVFQACAWQEEGFDGARFTLGWHLLEYASEKCDRGMLLEADDVLTTLRGHYTALAHKEGWSLKKSTGLALR